MSALATTVLVCSLWGIVPGGSVATDQVDLIEYNHFYDEQGRHVFDQLIFYEWSRSESRYQIRDWRLIKTSTQIPYRDVRRNLYVVSWHDGQHLREVRSDQIRETWTQYDPELVERSVLPKEQRRELTSLIRLEQANGRGESE
jgi:hypothetical protein